MAAPFLVLLFPPSQAVPLVLISWFPIAVILVVGSRRHLVWPRLLRLLVPAFLGAPIGIYGLASLPDATMRAVIGGISLVAVATMALRPGEPWSREAPALVGAGFVSGILGGASGLSGPPIVLLGLRQRWEHESFRATLLCFFFLLHTSVALTMGNVGILTGDTLWLAVQALPGVAAGYGVGMWLKRHVDSGMYRRLAVALVAVGGLLAVAFYWRG